MNEKTKKNPSLRLLVCAFVGNGDEELEEVKVA